MPVVTERHGWRDEWLSRRHRLWGWDCPWQDVDWLEYDNGEPVALFEYKHEKGPQLDQTHLGVHAMIKLADRAGLPFFGVRYGYDPHWFAVTALNDIARTMTAPGRVNELAYVTWLYQLRARDLPDRVKADILYNSDAKVLTW